MKILITTDWYKPVINGVVTSVENLKKGLILAGHEVKILTLSGNIHSWREEDVYYVGSISAEIIYENARLKWSMPKQMMQEILKWKPDIVHSQCEFSTFRMAKEIASRCQIPLIHTYHTVYENYTHYFCFHHTMGKKIAEFFSRTLLADANAVIAPTEKIQTMLQNYGIEQPIFVIPSGIHIEKFMCNRSEKRRELREQFGIKPEECILLYVGRLAKEKNIEELFQILHKCGGKQRMLIVGDGPYRSELERKAETLGIEKQLIFAGMVPAESIADYYAAGDIFVCASNSETQGLTYMEAMASALPLLCKADECLDGVITSGENGLLYHTEDEFIQYVTRLKDDFILRNQMGILARQSIQERYSVQAFATSCIDVYSRAIPSAAGGCV